MALCHDYSKNYDLSTTQLPWSWPLSLHDYMVKMLSLHVSNYKSTAGIEPINNVSIILRFKNFFTSLALGWLYRFLLFLLEFSCLSGYIVTYVHFNAFLKLRSNEFDLTINVLFQGCIKVLRILLTQSLVLFSMCSSCENAMEKLNHLE